MDITKIKRLHILLSLKSFDTSTEEGRSNERYRRSIITTLSTILSKFLNFAVFTISIPLTIDYLGKEKFGLWMTMSSIILMATIFSDLGLGVALMNKSSEFRGSDRKDLVQTYVSNTFFLLVGIAVVLATVFCILAFYIDWKEIFKLQDSINTSEVAFSMTSLVIIFCINLPFTVVDRFQEGNQEGYLNYLWQGAGNLVGLAGIVLVVKMELGLLFLVTVSFGIPSLVRILNFTYQFSFKNHWAHPQFKLVNKAAAKDLLKMGFIFFVLNSFNVLGVHSDNFIISSTMGVSEVSLYSIIQKLSMVALIFWSFTTSLWPAYTEAIAKKDFNWVQTAIKRNLLLSLFSGILMGLLIIVSGKLIIKFLTKGLLEPDMQLLFGFAAYIFINGFISSFAVIFNASFLYKKQVKFFIIASCFSVFLKFFLGDRFGVVGIIWATTLGYGIFYVIPAYFLVKQTFWKNPDLQYP